MALHCSLDKRQKECCAMGRKDLLCRKSTDTHQRAHSQMKKLAGAAAKVPHFCMELQFS